VEGSADDGAFSFDFVCEALGLEVSAVRQWAARTAAELAAERRRALPAPPAPPPDEMWAEVEAPRRDGTDG
jgi:hypothetical protein